MRKFKTLTTIKNPRYTFVYFYAVVNSSLVNRKILISPNQTLYLVESGLDSQDVVL